ncbi:hypothetical protein DPMN_182268 [Dreissena polymorpha]|uniref:Uncharacterized protein n=1 Tax=Dreissena polymorpha TaxID=45954 RepID=A0A9D4I2F5_DREPO|nr:hypothetical protein DPMN_182268 [Dreissena polymorpha]
MPQNEGNKKQSSNKTLSAITTSLNHRKRKHVFLSNQATTEGSSVKSNNNRRFYCHIKQQQKVLVSNQATTEGSTVTSNNNRRF